MNAKVKSTNVNKTIFKKKYCAGKKFSVFYVKLIPTDETTDFCL